MAYAGVADIKITNPNSVDLTDFQVRITLDSTNFPYWNLVKDDGIDFYFTLSDGITEIPFWREEFDKINQKAVFWVKIPSISASSYTVIKMYFSNPYETIDKSNGSSTFLFYDNFNGSDLDLSVWETNSSNYSIESGYVKIWGGWNESNFYLRTKQEFTLPFIVEGKVKISTTGSDIDFQCYIGGNVGVFDSAMCMLIDDDSQDKQAFYDTDWISRNLGKGFVDTNWHKFKFTFKDGEYHNWWDDGEDVICDKVTGVTVSKVGIGADTDDANRCVYVDYIFIRKYVDKEPTVSIQSISLAKGTISSTLVRSNIQQYVESFTGDGTTTQFTLTKKSIIPKVRVFVDNIERIENTDFTVDYTNGIITFSTAPPNGSTITVVYYYGELDYIENATVKAYYCNKEWNSTTTGQYGKYEIQIPKNVEVQLKAETDNVDSITVVKLTD